MAPHIVWALVVLVLAGMTMFVFMHKQASLDNLSRKLDDQIARIGGLELFAAAVKADLSRVEKMLNEHQNKLNTVSLNPLKPRVF